MHHVIFGIRHSPGSTPNGLRYHEKKRRICCWLVFLLAICAEARAKQEFEKEAQNEPKYSIVVRPAYAMTIGKTTSHGFDFFGGMERNRLRFGLAGHLSFGNWVEEPSSSSGNEYLFHGDYSIRFDMTRFVYGGGIDISFLLFDIREVFVFRSGILAGTWVVQDRVSEAFPEEVSDYAAVYRRSSYRIGGPTLQMALKKGMVGVYGDFSMILNLSLVTLMSRIGIELDIPVSP